MIPTASNNVFVPDFGQADSEPQITYHTGEFLGLVEERHGLLIGYRGVQSVEEWAEATRLDAAERKRLGLCAVKYPEFTPPSRPINRYCSVTPVNIEVL